MEFITAFWDALVSVGADVSNALVSLFGFGLNLIYTPAVAPATEGTVTQFGWIVISMAALGFILSIVYLVINMLPKGK